MQYYFSSETSSSLDIQSYFRFQTAAPQNSTFNPFTMNQAKPSSLCQEDPSDTHLTNCFSPSDFTSFDNCGVSSPYYQNFNDREHFGDNFNFTLDIDSFRSIPQNQGLEKLRQKPIENFGPNSIDQFFCLSQESVSENQFKQEDSTIEPKQFEESAHTTKLNKASSAIKGWSEEDETMLKKLAVQYKFDWKKIAKKFDNKKYTPHFLKMRYKGYDEGPVPKRVKFSHEEDVLIAKCFNDYGIDWERMVSSFPHRTPVMLKNRFYSYIRKNNRLEALLKEIQTIEENHIEQNMSQLEGTTDCSAMASETDNDSQFQSEISTDVSSKKSRTKDEVARLKAQLKSLKSLYAVTYRELSQMKANH